MVIFWAVIMLAFATALAPQASAQVCEDCKIIKKGVPTDATPVGAQATRVPTATPAPSAPPTPAPSATAPEVSSAIVEVDLYWAEGCGYCKEVMDGILPQMRQLHGERLDVRMVEVLTTEDISDFYAAAAHYGFARGEASVPFLIIGDRALVGDEQITREWPGLIEAALAAGGTDRPDPAASRVARTPTAFAPAACSIATPCADETPPEGGPSPVTDGRGEGSNSRSAVLVGIGAVALGGISLLAVGRKNARRTNRSTATTVDTNANSGADNAN